MINFDNTNIHSRVFNTKTKEMLYSNEFVKYIKNNNIIYKIDLKNLEISMMLNEYNVFMHGKYFMNKKQKTNENLETVFYEGDVFICEGKFWNDEKVQFMSQTVKTINSFALFNKPLHKYQKNVYDIKSELIGNVYENPEILEMDLYKN